MQKLTLKNLEKRGMINIYKYHMILKESIVETSIIDQM